MTGFETISPMRAHQFGLLSYLCCFLGEQFACLDFRTGKMADEKPVF